MEPRKTITARVINGTPDPWLGGAPRLGDRPSTYLGRLIVELWEPGADSDGINLLAQPAAGSTLGAADAFVRTAVNRLHARVTGRPPVPLP